MDQKDEKPLESWPENFPHDEPDVPGLGGKAYQWVKNRYHKNRRPWKKSDVIVWKGTFTVVTVWIGYLIFAAIFGWFFIKLYDTYGISRMLSFMAVLVLWRINMMVKLLNALNRKL